MTELITAIAGLALVAVFPIAIVAFYRWQDRRDWERAGEQADQILRDRETPEQRARRYQ